MTSTASKLAGHLQVHKFGESLALRGHTAASGWMLDRVDAEAAIKVRGRSE